MFLSGRPKSSRAPSRAVELPLQRAADAVERVGVGVALVVVPAAAGVDERYQQERAIARLLRDARQLEPAERDAHFRRGDPAVVDHELVLAVAAHGVAAADRDALERQQRVGGQLQVAAQAELPVLERQAPGPLALAEPGEELAVGDVAAVLGGTQDRQAEAQRRAQRHDLLAGAVLPLLAEAECGDVGLAVLGAGREREAAAQAGRSRCAGARGSRRA